MPSIFLARNLLDHQLLDGTGRRCGNVDDLAIEGGAGEAGEVVAILAGPGYWEQRSRWIGRLAGKLGGGSKARIPWSEVRRVESGVELRGKAFDYGLGTGDDRARPLVARVPGSKR